ncbi:hypothetical protein LJC31_03385 [Synergistaceae bacterium OttesenSCG-928-I11]|nr:hypothetical protein [Synergistaceae bacterium OttesenSCG-928-I11]
MGNLMVSLLATTTGEIIEMFSSGVMLGISVYTAAKNGKPTPPRRRRR